MDAKDIRNLQEAYLEVYQELDEERVPVRKRGGISAPEDERSIGGEANRRNKDYWASVIGKNRDRGAGNKAKRRAAALNKEDVDIYDIILSHLLDEGYAETPEAAEVIMVNMSDDWRESIVEADSLAAQQERRRKRQAANMKKHGTPGFDYSKPHAQAAAEREERMKKFINKED